ncbi:MAG: beta-propeller domain-containing protein [Labilithrix sp.]|nr:beta-propeller domain-containing protein [Labilithrix sp.]
MACGTAAGVPAGRTGSTQRPLEALVPLQGCGEVEAYLRERLAVDVNRYVDQMIAPIEQIERSEAARGPRRGGFNNSARPTAEYSTGVSNDSNSASSSGIPASFNSASSGSGASQTSKTNNQVAGVDEADFVKNDDKYLYIVANGALRILQAWPANEAREVAKVTLGGEPRKLFVEGDRALVYVAVPSSSNGGGVFGGSYYGGECTYGYDCVPSGDGTRTKVLVFDIANRAAPAKVREIELSGSLLSARRVGNAVHTVVVDARTIDGLEDYPTDFRDDYRADPSTRRAAMKQAWEALRQRNLAAIANVDVLAMAPTATESGAPIVPACTGYYRPSVAEGTTFTTLFSIDIAGGAPTTATVISDPGVVYASDSGLYMSVPHSRSPGAGWYDSMRSEDHASLVHKFRIGATPSLTGYEASGIVKGRVLNQFALDEHDGHLRVATTSGHSPDPQAHSTMSVLERQDGSLVLRGKVDDIAPTEDIRSVRFDGPRGYVVTFKKTDPLYVFDLANPTAPSITGELKIPGFSTYMHMMDEKHLLTIGYDANDQGGFAWFSGVMLQIFDVSDMTNPTLAHKEIIGTRGSSSEALTNHLAFTYYAPKSLLALPMTVCEGGSGSSSGTEMTFSGLMVYDVTAQSGFAKRGQVSHPNAPAGSNPYDSRACEGWWTNARSEVRRSVIMDDFVYSISERRVKVNGLGNLSADIAEISLEE